MVRPLVLRGVVVGALGGLLAYVFGRIFATPLIQAAIDFESGRDQAKAALAAAAGQTPEAPDPELFSRAVQGNLGLGIGMMAFGVAVGLFFAVAFCMAYGRTGNLRPRQLSLLVALAGFMTLFFLPFLKYPANPPSIGNPDTMRDRGALYLLMMVASVLVAIASVWLGKRLRLRFGTWSATLLACTAFMVVIGALMAVLPPLGQLSANVEQSGNLLTETPQPMRNVTGAIVYPGFDADLLYRFRLFSVGAQAILWTAIGLTFAPLTDHVFRAHGAPTQQEVGAARA